MKRFNLSEWAITHRALVLFMILLIGAAGLFSYYKLGRAEDPSFTIKVMNIHVGWPGATAPSCRPRSSTRSRRSCRNCRISTASQLFAARHRLHPGHPVRHHAAAGR